jgi:hypothetical protein
MNDLNKEELEVGNRVAFTTAGSSGLYVGIVIKITTKRVRIQRQSESARWGSFLVRQDQVLLLERRPRGDKYHAS